MCRGQEMVHVLMEFIIVILKEMYLTRFIDYAIISEWWKPKSHERITWPTLLVSLHKDFF